MILVHCDKEKEVIDGDYYEVTVTVKRHTKDSLNVTAYPQIARIYCPDCIKEVIQALGGEPIEWIDRLPKGEKDE